MQCRRKKSTPAGFEPAPTSTEKTKADVTDNFARGACLYMRVDTPFVIKSLLLLLNFVLYVLPLVLCMYSECTFGAQRGVRKVHAEYTSCAEYNVKYVEYTQSTSGST